VVGNKASSSVKDYTEVILVALFLSNKIDNNCSKGVRDFYEKHSASVKRRAGVC
jgi:hypothetical protein